MSYTFHVPKCSDTVATGYPINCNASCSTCLYIGFEIFDTLSKASRLRGKAEQKRVLIVIARGREPTIHHSIGSVPESCDQLVDPWTREV